MGQSEALLKSTTRFWQARTERAFSDEDARVCTENIAGFFDLLERWASRGCARQDNPKEGLRAGE